MNTDNLNLDDLIDNLGGDPQNDSDENSGAPPENNEPVLSPDEQADADAFSFPDKPAAPPEPERVAVPDDEDEPETEPDPESEPEPEYDYDNDEAPQSYQQDAPPEPPRRKKSPSDKKKKRKRKKQRSRLPGVLILTTFIFGVSIILSLVIIGYGKDMFGIGKSDRTTLLVIPEGATTDDIANMLESEGIIRSPDAFKLFSRLKESDGLFVPGEHFVRPNMAYETLINELTSEQVEEQGESVQITFPEGITLIEAAKKLEENNICKADDFIFYFNSGGFGFEFEEMLPSDTTLKFERMEGYLFPDTYYFFEGMDVEQVCQKIYLNFDEKLTDDRIKRMKELNLTLDELITFSSIVQREAATTDVMTLVASVFWNRLNHPDVFPMLQSDPTSNYANDVVRPNMTVFDETIVNAYDTYKSTGLPPGAICNPGIEAIDAVLTAYESDYYYFYANLSTGETRFAETLEEHEQNIADFEYENEQASAAAAAEEAGY